MARGDSSIIPSAHDCGGVMVLSEAVARYPDFGVVAYNRVSSWGQAGPGKVKLEAKTDPLVDAVRELAPGRLRAIKRAVEEGKLSKPRRKLAEAAKVAAARGCILVAPDLSRFVRAEAYDRRKNCEAWPTADEFRRLRELTLGVPLATLVSPFSSEAKRHSAATRRTGKAGRPRKITPELADQIFDFLGCLFMGPRPGKGGWQYEQPLSVAAEQFDVSPAAIFRASERMSPSGVTWREAAIRKAIEKGWVEVGKSGEMIDCYWKAMERVRRGKAIPNG